MDNKLISVIGITILCFVIVYSTLINIGYFLEELKEDNIEIGEERTLKEISRDIEDVGFYRIETTDEEGNQSFIILIQYKLNNQ